MGFMQPLQMKALSLKLQQFAQSPSAISAVASIGVHALLFVVLPLLPDSTLKAREPDIKSTVELVELTPEEQTRLPEISNAPLELPPIAQEPLPSDPNQFSLNPLPTPPAPSSFSLFPDIPTTSSIPAPPIIIFPDAPPARPVVPQPIPSNPSTPSTPSTRSPAVQSPQPSGLSAAPTNPADGERPSTTDNQPFVPNSSPTASPEDSNSQPAPRRPSINDEILARRNQIAQQLAQLEPDETGTGGTDVSRNRYIDWFEEAVSWLGKDYDEKNAEQIELEVPYPEAACLRGLSGTAIVGVVVNADGKVVTDPVPPELLQGSGYRIFNQEALDAAAEHQFEPTGKKKAYQVEVEFEYAKDKCPAGSAITPQPQG
jgi:TonB family protein